MCYSIRYFDRNSRPDTKAIWSERHVAFYHSLDHDNAKFRWIVVQPPKRIESCIRDAVQALVGREITWTEQLKLHAIFMSVIANTWRAYINYLEGLLSELVSAICDIQRSS